MSRIILITLLFLLQFSPLTQANPEYLRFAGQISGGYDVSSDGYDAALGFTAGQNVYFDFYLDTTQEAAGYTDGSNADYFYNFYVNGSISGGGPTYGVTVTFPEGVTTLLDIQKALQVGVDWDTLNAYNPGYFGIDTWSVGDSVSLMNNGNYANNIIGTLVLTYRDTTAPAAYVPLPPALWLFISGLALLFARRRG